jgi:hypothetical protein
MLCVANIKILLFYCLEPRASTPAQADQIVRLLKAWLASPRNSGNNTRQYEVPVEAGERL